MAAPIPGEARLTTLTLFGIKPGHVRWGLAQMGTSVPHLQKVPGLLFFKLLGSGQGKGFSIKPNFYRYGLLCTWESEEAAKAFLHHSCLLEEYKKHTFESWTLYLEPLQSHGLWDKQSPFEPFSHRKAAEGPIAVLTRASINWRALPGFWKFVPKTSKALENAQGLICSIGLGELPFVRQATFSVWESAAAMKQYAYHNPLHQEVMKRTRAENWYSEELFARFIPIASEGTWNGVDPVTLSSLSNVSE
ncbi:spheroidene monooxygenase [Pontibacter sp. SGAir0037]|uniref:spheroidene monooxygenase n=1 Tax=Pontibacter sp. SGAir0037 TaxID=2571030 RepID=UPI0010CD3319|nr:spheroidene monooxygenase [Pontibacter sp. SGAir0037]QCR22017.1 spheroidene monooxygenase [Pontibacter sp. SGAir0037]